MKTIDSHLSLHADSVRFRSLRAQILAGNLSNADTPGYKPSDVSFNKVLNRVRSVNLEPTSTHQNHLRLGDQRLEFEKFYRQTTNTSWDKNSVNSEFERAQFADNAIRYQASLQFLSSKISGLVKAIRGE